MRAHKESGQALLLAVVAVGLLLTGALGLAIDSSQLYGQKQMAQLAADAAAEAGIITVFKTGTLNNGTAFSCDSSHATLSPCTYASQNGFASAGTDTINV